MQVENDLMNKYFATQAIIISIPFALSKSTNVDALNRKQNQ